MQVLHSVRFLVDQNSTHEVYLDVYYSSLGIPDDCTIITTAHLSVKYPDMDEVRFCEVDPYFLSHLSSKLDQEFLIAQEKL
jgi:hypothetical protein